ncbi:peptidoglycan-binding domain-containing protein [Kribbella sp. DT2]|uniref:peptidoglycan-binding domain-containing protein n=1 Tax=Kribbella sp. DT2 TaxID=3393427 RepID=UPI003CEA4D72
MKFGMRMAGTALATGGLAIGGALTSAAAPVPAGQSGQAAVAALATCNRTLNVVTPTRYAVLPAAADLECQMGIGSAGPEVTPLQVSLNRCHGAGLTVDSIYGPKTADAVRLVQSKAGIPADGIYGPQTRRVVYWLFSNGSCARVLGP